MIHLYDAKSFAKLRAAQYAAFHTDAPGSWFNHTSGILDAVEDGTPVLAIGVESGDAIVFDKNAQRIVAYKEKSVKAEDGSISMVQVENGFMKQGHRGWLVDLTGELVGCSPVVAEFDGHRYASGMVIVTGKGNSGKTPLVHALGEALGGKDKYATVRFGEPLSGYNTDFNVFVDDVARAMLQHRVIVIDSLKNVIGAAGGNTTSGGISRGAFDLLSDLGAMAASRGCVVIASLNPTSNDDKIVELVKEASRSNSTSLVISTDVEGEWQVLTRTGEGLQRLTHSLQTSYGEHSVLSIHTSKQRGGKPSSARAIQTVIKNDELESVLRRLTSN